MKKHELSDRLTKAFITPIEREDIAALSEQIDDLTDKIEEVFIRIYINNVKAIRPEALKMLELVIQCCEEVCGLMREFANFRRSKELKDRIIQINSLEEEAGCISPACTAFIQRKRMCWPSSHGGRFTAIWKNAPMPASMPPTWWRAWS